MARDVVQHLRATEVALDKLRGRGKCPRTPGSHAATYTSSSEPTRQWRAKRRVLSRHNEGRTALDARHGPPPTLRPRRLCPGGQARGAELSTLEATQRARRPDAARILTPAIFDIDPAEREPCYIADREGSPEAKLTVVSESRARTPGLR
jgi:hypothetical protein